MSVCDNQDTFNQAFHDAVKYEMKKERPDKKTRIIGGIIYIILLFWAVSLAMKIDPQAEKVEHIFFALLFPPLYIIAHYVGKQ